MNYTEDVIKSFVTVKEMIQDRAIHDPRYRDSVLDQISEQQLQQHASKQVFMIHANNQVGIIYHLNQKFKVTDIKKFVDEQEKQLYILIIKEKLTGSNQKSLSGLKIEIQCFDIRELMFNISKHRLVPKHDVIADEKEIEAITSVYNIKSRFQFPIILRTDPMARYLDIKPGQLVKITRVSPSVGESVIYRCCT